MLENLKSIIRGELGLATTFWAYFILIPAVVSLVLLLSLEPVLSDESLSIGVRLGINLLAAIFTWFMLIVPAIAVFNASKDYKSNMKAMLARIVVVIMVVFSVVSQVYSFTQPSALEAGMASVIEDGTETIEEAVDSSDDQSESEQVPVSKELNDFVTILNETTPDDLGDGVILTSFEAKADTIIVNSKLDVEYFESIGVSVDQVLEDLTFSCNDVIDFFDVESVGAVETVFDVGGEVFSVSFSRSECL